MIGGKQSLSKSLISFKPAWATSTFFRAGSCTAPSPFRGAGERRSMAFNAYVDYADG